MGGGRLTAQDRGDIEAGLADGLPYAAIGRRLGRPTSTVSREVARNGGPGGYRAEHADRADTWRRRNRQPRPPAQTAAEAGTDAETDAGADTETDAPHGRDPSAVHAYEDRFATLLIGTGLPRTAARVLACLVTAPSGARTAAELAQRLRVSPASVSKAVGYLEGLDVLTREYEPGRRRAHHVVDDDVWLRAWLTSAQQNAAWAETAREGADLFGAGTPAGARLDAMRTFFAGVHRDMTGPSATTPTSASAPTPTIAPTAATPVLDDALTVLAALLHAARPLTAGELAAALGWPPARTTTALEAAEHRPEVSGPLTLERTPSGAHLVTPQHRRLTPAQRTALARRPAP